MSSRLLAVSIIFHISMELLTNGRFQVTLANGENQIFHLGI